MNVPKPGSWLKPINAPVVRTPFVLKDHLTNRPLLHNPELVELRNEIKKGNTK